MYIFNHQGKALPVADHLYNEAIEKYKITDLPGTYVADEEWEKAGGIARIIKGKVVLGKTKQEQKDDEVQALVNLYKENLKNTDYVVIKIAEAFADSSKADSLKKEYASVLKDRVKWRNYISEHST